MTKAQLFQKLQSAGIPRKSGDWKDYELCKSIFEGKYMETKEYENFIKLISEYCGV